jgi:glutamyl-tRNA synthetase
LGGAHTALFNWLFARHHHGVFILRIEDTDKERSEERFVEEIQESLLWLGLDWDEGPYHQSERLQLYHDYTNRLVQARAAYYCDCDPEDLEGRRQKALDLGHKPRYDGSCRERGLAPGANTAVRFKTPQTGTTCWQDQIKGHIAFENHELDDLVIMRADGIPTYNLAVVVDDITMGVNTIIRGDDHVSNTPKQILLFQAFDSPLPTFGHVPMVLGKDKARLSKRHGATSVTAYRDMGFLPEAFLNYLVRLGWSHGDQEFFTVAELVEKFSLENIGRSAGVFDFEKLLALNADHIQAMPPRQLAPRLIPFLEAEGVAAAEGPFIERVIATLQPRSKTLVDMARDARFYYAETITYDEQAAAKFLTRDAVEPLERLARQLEALPAFTPESLEGAFQAVMAATGLKLGKIAQPVRVALTGRTASPGIFEITEIIGKDKVLERLRAAAAFIQDPAA